MKVWLVQDQNSGDGYATTLATTFPAALASAARKAKRTFTLLQPGQSVMDQATALWFTQSQYGFPAMFPQESLDDSWAIMFHDGVQTAVTAVEELYAQTGTIPPAGEVANELNQVHVHGASGYICFDAEHDPIDKAVAMVQLTNGETLSYKELSSASGSAPTGGNCG